MQSSKKSKKPSVYERVKDILNDIQGSIVPDYQGYRAFWLSIDTFESVELYGQKMISPPLGDEKPDEHTPSSGGCCGGDSTEGSGAAGGDDSDPAVAAVNTQPTGDVTADCWPSGGHGGGGVEEEGGDKRSDRSGIIKGLRGEAPFDGNIFPPLLWDADREATEAEIKFIAEWIDAGCPVEDDEKTNDDKAGTGAKRITVSRDEKLALACGDKPHAVSSRCTNVDRKDLKGLSVRKEISTLTEKELTRLRNALECMYQYNPYWQDERSFDHWARMHTNSCQHGWEQFLPWHRLYLYFFEQTLQDFDPNITLPYWSWADYADANATTFNNTELDLGVIPEAYRCWLTSSGLDVLKNTKNPLKGESYLFSKKEISGLEKVYKGGVKYNSGLRLLNAAGISYSLIKDPSTQTAVWSDKIRTIYDVLRRINPLWFPNRWPGAMISPTSYPTKKNIQNILGLSAWSDFGGGPEYDHHFGALEQVHNGMHNFSGGQNSCYPYFGNQKWIKEYEKLGIPKVDQQNKENPPFGWMTDNRITAFDPIFWAHHSNVDRIWAGWQELHPNANPEELDGALAPWSLTVRDTLSVKKLGYEYMRDTFHYPTTKDIAITKFNSDKCGVCQTVLDTHRKADIRLHRVQRGNMHNASIRMFLNDPKANINTPTENNDNFVGEITTFHGTCYGGPGHCGLPLEKSRPFDHRKLHHHEPRNYRIDATDTVQKLLAKGEEDLSVHLVVVGMNGQPVDNALYIDGVSLNFLD